MKINNREFGWNEIDGTCYLYNSANGTFYYINETGKKIWDVIQHLNMNGEYDKETIFDEILNYLNQEFPQVNENISNDVIVFIQQMITINAIIMENER